MKRPAEMWQRIVDELIKVLIAAEKLCLSNFKKDVLRLQFIMKTSSMFFTTRTTAYWFSVMMETSPRA